MDSRKKREDSLITLLFCGAFVFLTYHYAYTKVMMGGQNDYPSHVFTLLPQFRGATWWKGWMAAPHCLWHVTILFLNDILMIPVEAAAAFSTVIYSMLFYLVLLWAIRKVTERAGCKENLLRSNIFTFAFCFVQGLYFYWMDAGDRYLGIFSMNPLHNPTQMGVRGFALICFLLAIDILGNWSEDRYQPIFFTVEGKGKKPYLLLAGMLFLSTVMKPTFTEVFVPAVAFFMLKEWLFRIFHKTGTAKEYFGHCLRMLLCAVPSLLYVLAQGVVFFILGGGYNSEGGMIITKWMEVWKMFSQNVTLSILLGMAFPIYMLLIDGRYFLKSREGQIAWLSYIVGMLEAALLGEEGSRMTHANFIWPMMSGMLLVWIVAFFRLLTLEKKFSEAEQSAISESDNKLQRRLVLVGWGLFFAHFLCGMLYLSVELTGL